jgi:hypothetical protein
VLAYQSRYLRYGVGANDLYETELAFLLTGSCEPGCSNIAAMVRSMFDVVIFSRVQSCYGDPDPTQKTTTGWCFENPLPQSKGDDIINSMVIDWPSKALKVSMTHGRYVGGVEGASGLRRLHTFYR